MPIANNDSSRSYTCNGEAYRFPVPFVFFDEALIEVAQDEVVLILNTDYVVERNATTYTGLVELATPPAEGVVLTVTRLAPLLQATEVPTTYDPQSLTRALDTLTLMVQRMSALMTPQIVCSANTNMRDGTAGGTPEGSGKWVKVLDLGTLVIGVDVQARNAVLDMFSGAVAADTYQYFYSASVLGVASISPAARALLACNSSTNKWLPYFIDDDDADVVYVTDEVFNFIALATGAANAHLEVNSVATAFAWIASTPVHKSVVIDLTTATGTVTITGVGFTPRAVICFGYCASAIIWCIGFALGAASQTFLSHRADDIMDYNTGAIAALSSALNWWQVWAITSVNSDGCVLSNTKTGSPTGTGTLELLFLR
jgi:hypothetical protein